MAYTPARVTDITWLTPTILEVTLRRDHDAPFPLWQAGQYVLISFPGQPRLRGNRPFSISSPPADPTMLRIGIRVMGKFTKTLPALRVGDSARVTGPFGAFVLHPTETRVVLLGGGIGVTPLVSIFMQAAVTSWGGEMNYIASHRSVEEVAYADRLLEAAQGRRTFRVVTAVEGVASDAERGIVSGRITADLVHQYLTADAREYVWYICGPTPFMAAMRTMIRGLGVPEDRIHSELFAVAPPTIFERTWTPKVVFAGWAVVAASIFGVVYGLERANRVTVSPSTYTQQAVESIAATADAYRAEHALKAPANTSVDPTVPPNSAAKNTVTTPSTPRVTPTVPTRTFRPRTGQS